MALNSIMNSALTGLFTSQSALSVTSNNIANVNTPGYAREVVVQEPIINGTSASGVKISGIERIVDQFLQRASLSSAADHHQYSVEKQFHDRVQALLGRPDQQTSLSGRVDSMFSSIADLSLDPGSSVLRQNMVSGIDSFTGELSRLSGDVQTLRTDASAQISNRVNRINAALEQISYLNPIIIRETTLGHSTGGLEGQRDQALTELAELIDIRTTDTGKGGMAITTSTGVTLFDGVVYQLQYSSPATATAETTFPPITLSKKDPITGNLTPTGTKLDSSIISGELRGLLNMRDQILPGMAQELGELGRQFTQSINAMHNSLTAFPAPNQLAGVNKGMLAGDAHGFTGQASFAVVDASGAVVNKVDIDFDALPPGATINDVLTAINTGLAGAGTMSFGNGTMTFTAANSANGVVIAQDDVNPADRGGQGFSHFFGMNDLVKARVPAYYDTGFSATDAHSFTAGGTVNIELRDSSNRILTDYTMTIPAGGTFNDLLNDLNGAGALGQYATFSMDADGALVVTPQTGFESLNANVTSDTTARGASQKTFSSLFGLGARYVADAASDMGVVNTIKNNANRLALATFDQTAAVGQVAMTKGDQSGVMKYQALETTSASFEAVGNLSAFEGSLSQFAASFLSNAGLMAEMSVRREDDTGALLTEINQRKGDISGVNIDEELSNMIIYQNAYNAAARVITTVQELYDSLLAAVR